MTQGDVDVEVRRPAALQRATLYIVYLSICVFVLSLWVTKGHEFNTYAPATLQRMLEGGASRPYALRVLVFQSAAAVVDVFEPDPKETRRLLDANPTLKRFAWYIRVPPHLFWEMVVALGLCLASLFGFVLCLRELFRELYTTRGPPADWMPVAALATLTALFEPGTRYIYDFPALFFFTAGLLALVKERMAWFYAVAVLGFLNKETMALVSIAFVLFPPMGLSRQKVWMHATAQLAMFAVLRLGLLAIFDPATTTHVADNYLRDFLWLNLSRLWNSGFFMDYESQVILAVLLIALFSGFQSKPAFLRRTSVVSVPLFVAYLIGGVWSEVRVFYEVFAVGFLLLYDNVMRLLGAPLEAREMERPAAIPLGRHGHAAGLALWWVFAALLVAAAAAGFHRTLFPE